MIAIQLPVIINSVRSRRDKSIGFSAETPELTDEQRNVFFNLQGTNAKMLLEPEEGSKEIIKVEKDPDTKSQSQRLRAVIGLVCKRLNRPEDQEKVYFREMEEIINKYKEKLERLPE